MSLEEKVLEELEKGPKPYWALKKLGKKSGEVSQILYELRNEGVVYCRPGPDGRVYYSLAGIRRPFLKLKLKFKSFIERKREYPELVGLEKRILEGIDPILAYNTFRRSGFEMSRALSFHLYYEIKTGEQRYCEVYIPAPKEGVYFEGYRENKELEDVVLRVWYGFDEAALSNVLSIEAAFMRLPGKVERVVEKEPYVMKIAGDIGPTLQERTRALGAFERMIGYGVYKESTLYKILEEVWYKEPKGRLSERMLSYLRRKSLGIGESKQKLAELIVALLYRLGEIKIEKGKLSLESLCLARR